MQLQLGDGIKKSHMQETSCILVDFFSLHTLTETVVLHGKVFRSWSLKIPWAWFNSKWSTIPTYKDSVVMSFYGDTFVDVYSQIDVKEKKRPPIQNIMNVLRWFKNYTKIQENF